MDVKLGRSLVMVALDSGFFEGSSKALNPAISPRMLGSEAPMLRPKLGLGRNTTQPTESYEQLLGDIFDTARSQ